MPLALNELAANTIHLVANDAMLNAVRIDFIPAPEPTVAYGCLIAAAIAFGLGECLHATVLLPLVADLAPLELRGRYMASIGLSWWLGLALAPTVGAPLLAVSASLALLVAAALSGAAILSLLALGARLPVGLRLIPRPQTAPVPRPLLRRGE